MHLTDIHAKLADAGVMETVPILLFTDYGTKIYLGTYAPVITTKEGGGQDVTFPTATKAGGPVFPIPSFPSLGFGQKGENFFH